MSARPRSFAAWIALLAIALHSAVPLAAAAAPAQAGLHDLCGSPPETPQPAGDQHEGHCTLCVQPGFIAGCTVNSGTVEKFAFEVPAFVPTEPHVRLSPTPYPPRAPPAGA